jgi:hypothetical protein
MDADAVAAAVSACADVVRLSGGVLGEVATYLPGRRVNGVRVREDGGVEVHVVARYGPTVAEIAAQVRAAVTAICGPVPVHVGIDDLELDPVPGAASGRAGAAGKATPAGSGTRPPPVPRVL